MPHFMVERYLPGMAAEAISAAAGRAGREAERSEVGKGVRYLNCVFVPSEESVFCLFEGPSAEAVTEINKRASFPFDRIVEVVTLPLARIASMAGRHGNRDDADTQTVSQDPGLGGDQR